MTWQEPVVALIVGLAVFSLYRHLRDMLRIAKPGNAGSTSCHGCDDCDDDRGAAPSMELVDERRSAPKPPA